MGDSGIGAPDDADGTDQLDVLGIVLDEAVSHRVQQPGFVEGLDLFRGRADRRAGRQRPVHPLHARVEVVLHGCQAADWIGVLDRRDIADGLVLTEKFLVSQA